MLDLISQIPLIGGVIAVALPFVFVLSIVIFVHEMGHYLVGRWCGIHALKFSLGMGPVLMHRYDKHGTKWQLAAIPIGGMVQFLGDADGASRADFDKLAGMDDATRKKTFHGAAVWKRALTVAAGPVTNFLLSALVFAGLAMTHGLVSDKLVIGEVRQLPGIENPLMPGDRILSANGEEITTFGGVYDVARKMDIPGPMQMVVERGGETKELTVPYVMPPLVGDATLFGAARKAGLLENDFITAINGEPVTAFRELLAAVENSQGNALQLSINRDGKEISIPVAPKVTEFETEDGSYDKNYRIGVALNAIYFPQLERLGPLDAAEHGVMQVYSVLSRSLNAMKQIILGGLSAKNLQGPLGIAQISGDQAKRGFVELIFLIGIISTAVGLVNLFPVPILDGGHLCLFAYEAVTGKAPTERALQMIMPVGLAMVVLLMLFATYNDLIRLVEQFTS